MYADRLENNNIPVTHGQSSFADKRFVKDLIYFKDPQGNQIELIFDPMKDSDPFKPSRPISGFKTGALGMGHVVLHAKDFNKLVELHSMLHQSCAKYIGS